MKEDLDECGPRNRHKSNSQRPVLPRNINSLLSDLVEKEEEITLYKERLQELETAFYYNLEIISERDLELEILEKRLDYESDQLQRALQEIDELKNVLKSIDRRDCKKIQQLERALSIREKEFAMLQKENVRNIKMLEKDAENVKRKEEKKTRRLAMEFESDKRKLMEEFKGEIEEKEKFYLLEIDKLSGKLEEAKRKEVKLKKLQEENKNLKYRIVDTERLFREKENNYQRELCEMGQSRQVTDQEIQCALTSKVEDKQLQAQPGILPVACQTSHAAPDSEEQLKKKVLFLQEQNEVLKCVIKDLKKNNEFDTKSGELREECNDSLATKEEVRTIHDKFENEINNLKNIIKYEQTQRTEEETIMQSLEASMTYLKDRLVANLRCDLENFSGDDVCNYTYNHMVQNKIQLAVLEEQISKKMDYLLSVAEEERQKVNDKLEELKRECIEKMEKFMQPKDESIDVKSENLLEKIRMEILKLEYKIESDMKNMMRNNCETEKCNKNFQTQCQFPKAGLLPFSASVPSQPDRHATDLCLTCHLPEVYCRNDISNEKCITVSKGGRKGFAQQNQLTKALDDFKTYRKLTNYHGER